MAGTSFGVSFLFLRIAGFPVKGYHPHVKYRLRGEKSACFQGIFPSARDGHFSGTTLFTPYAKRKKYGKI
ncbi:MAG: hypothetical protein Q3X94_08395, partial [Oscillospiraceae bacterium]|nr:hypothetical protein [Oscillospiraceae bacterium]